MRTRISESLENPQWDDFLESRSDGHFQQSSAWAQHKASQGWACIRMVLEEENKIVGGFQMLWKRTRRGKVGYVSKGPVIPSRSADSIRAMLDSIKKVVSDYRILATIIQSPDDSSSELIQIMERANLTSCSNVGVIDTTILMDVTLSSDKILASLRSSARSMRNKAIRNGLTVRDGDIHDLPVFFDLMLRTCERQNTNPRPRSLDDLRAIWNALNSHSRHASLRLVEHKGKVLCGALLINFGKRTTIYKVGWNGMHGEANPNPLLFTEILLSASRERAEIVDFAAFDRDLANSMLNGIPISQELRKRRDFYKSAYGGHPQLLPAARIWVRNPSLRFCFKWAIRVPALSAIIRKSIA
ncbi:MAG: hypothetical protein ACI92G_001503 [Candidatus Pelagisphaera sp.]|jgi:hypothetical protein